MFNIYANTEIYKKHYIQFIPLVLSYPKRYKIIILYCGPSLIVVFKLHPIGQTYSIWSSTSGHIWSSLVSLLVKHSKTKMFNISANTAIYKNFLYTFYSFSSKLSKNVIKISWTREGLCGTRIGTLLLALLSRNV